MGDKGFLISDLCTPKGIYLIVPPTKKMSNYQNMKWNKPDALQIYEYMWNVQWKEQKTLE